MKSQHKTKRKPPREAWARRLALAGAALALGGCAPNFDADPRVGYENARHLGLVAANLEAGNRARTELLEKYYVLDAAQRYRARDRKFRWILDQYRARGAKLSPAEALRFAEAYTRDTDLVRERLGEQWANIRAFDARGKADVADLDAFMLAQSRQAVAERSAAAYGSERLQAFALEQAQVVSEAWAERQAYRASLLSPGGEEPAPEEEFQEEAPADEPAPPDEGEGGADMAALLRRF